MFYAMNRNHATPKNPRATMKFTRDSNYQDSCRRMMRWKSVWLTFNRRGVLVREEADPLEAAALWEAYTCRGHIKSIQGKCFSGGHTCLGGMYMPSKVKWCPLCKHAAIRCQKICHPHAYASQQRSICPPRRSRYDYPRVARPAPIYRLAT